jgi:hypothetical protein
MRTEIVAVANVNKARFLSFIVEKLRDGKLSAFVPSAPTPTAGNVYVLIEQQVQRLEVPAAAPIRLNFALP